MLSLPTVKISVRSVTSIEQPSTGTDRGLGAMPHKENAKAFPNVPSYDSFE
jgi:hypothetical protein